MPVDLTALLIALVAIFPGIIGNKIYKAIVGIYWQEQDYQSIMRLLGFSVMGIILYSITSSYFMLLPPTHIFPSVYKNIAPNNINTLFIYPYIGHLTGGAISGLMGAWVAKGLAYFSSSSAYPSAWDDFIRKHVPNHWVVVSLTSGEVYAGKLISANLSVSQKERDIILEEPCEYDYKNNNYTASNYQHIFIPASLLHSIAVVHESSIDSRMIPIGDKLFDEGGNKHE